jgi:TM2 domain-containing membrane protein YozV
VPRAAIPSVPLFLNNTVRRTKHATRTLVSDGGWTVEKIWVIKGPDEYLKPRPSQWMEKEVSPPSEQDPALAYTLSLIFWGSGQLYNGQRTKGMSYIGLALCGNAFAFLLFMFQQEITSYLLFCGISPAQAVLVAAFLLFCCLFFWVSNASDAYHAAMKARRTTFTGVTGRAWPVLCSLLFPGWGQFLNGQPVKGGLFAVSAMFGIFSLLSVLGILQVWPFLEDSNSRFIVEIVLVLSLFSLLPMPFIWVLGVFDAWKVVQDDIMKEPIIERLKAANNRRRVYGWVRGVFPQIKRTFMLAFILISLIIMTVRFYFPWNYYREDLMHALSWSSKQGMMIIPELVRGIISAVPAK